ncbi:MULTISPECIES: hypothetical protein [Burkholderiales]|uniref:Uncharacterized protein n=2 Tax=Burkholderiales TaxID=80840 RepID=A0ABZ3GGI4_ACHDE
MFSTAPRPFRPGRGETQNPGVAVAAPGVEGQQPNQNAAAFAVAQAAALKASLYFAMPSGTGPSKASAMK